MHTESRPSLKLSGELDASLTPNDTSLLEDDLALSSSTLGLRDKSLQDQSKDTSRLYNPGGRVVYVNEDTMDCSYPESAETPRKNDPGNQVSSPEMFESDDEDDDKNGRKDFRELLPRQRDKSSCSVTLSMMEKCVKPTVKELIAKSDCYLLARMNKFMTGVPPPPKHTICQSDCADLLASIRSNCDYFLVNPFQNSRETTTRIDEQTTRNKDETTTIDDETTRTDEKTTRNKDETATIDDKKTRIEDETARTDEKTTRNKDETATIDDKKMRIEDEMARIDDKTTRIVEKTIINVTEQNVQNPTNGHSFNNHRGKSSLRNLTNAFDACVRNDETTSVEDESTRGHFSENSNDRRTGSESTSNDNVPVKVGKSYEIEGEITTGLAETSTSYFTTNREKSRRVTFKMSEDEPERFYNTIPVEDVKNMTWELAYEHKTHGIHYNRSKTVEEFESLTMKFCQRYVGAETQSSCNIWFTKQTPGSVKKRNLLSRRNNGQSPGKRLSHLARRRRTFSSANLQGLGMVDKKQLVLNIKKPTIRRGKSPRGKSPRGGSAKKRAGLSRVSPSPRKARLETSKRALFQSPPGERAAGPSNGTTTSLVSTGSQHRIKRALFPTSKTKDEVAATTTRVSDIKRALNFEETRKRKNDEDLEGPRFKWAKSLSFDCAQVNEGNSADSWTNERHSTGNFNAKTENSLQQGKSELSETHRKKLLWAVAEVLRGKGICMGHPRFKQCASQLFRTVKKYMPDLENPNVPRKPGSTSDRMLRLAKRHVLLIVESKSTE